MFPEFLNRITLELRGQHLVNVLGKRNFKLRFLNVTLEKKVMGELIFVGLGLNNEKDISLNGIEECKTADYVFLELYTSILSDFSKYRFEKIIGRKVDLVSRSNLEEDDGALLINAARRGKAVFLVPGDPLIATTHITLRIAAEKQGIKTRIIHGTSIISAVVGLSCLQNYKFGKTVTVPLPDNFSETPYNVIAQNKKSGLHTLCLLDIKAEEKVFLTINEALVLLSSIEKRRGKGVVTPKTVVIGLARVGSKDSILKADYVERLLREDFGDPPHSLIFPGQLHFIEAEALVVLAGAPETIRSTTK